MKGRSNQYNSFARSRYFFSSKKDWPKSWHSEQYSSDWSSTSFTSSPAFRHQEKSCNTSASDWGLTGFKPFDRPCNSRFLFDFPQLVGRVFRACVIRSVLYLKKVRSVSSLAEVVTPGEDNAISWFPIYSKRLELRFPKLASAWFCYKLIWEKE